MSAAEEAKFAEIAGQVTSPLDRPATERFTVIGAIYKTVALLALLIVGGFVGWNAVDPPTLGSGAQIPGWIALATIGGLACVGLAYFKPRWAPFLGPAYALVKGLVVGAISHVYEIAYEGIVLQAVIATIAVFAVMLGLYSSRTIRVTPKLQKVVMTGTLAIMAVYLFQFVMNLIGVNFAVPFLHDSGPIGILISLAIIGFAAFNLLLDFDWMEKAEQNGSPRWVEWLLAMGLVVTLVWLYFELLRLLSKLRD